MGGLGDWGQGLTIELLSQKLCGVRFSYYNNYHDILTYVTVYALL